jgi:hypothetical protein
LVMLLMKPKITCHWHLICLINYYKISDFKTKITKLRIYVLMLNLK